MGFWEDFFRRFTHLRSFFSYLILNIFSGKNLPLGNILANSRNHEESLRIGVSPSTEGGLPPSQKPSNYRLVLLGVALTCLFAGGIAGFFLGPAVQANISEPGSSEDPLVSRSYVDEKLGDYIEKLEAELEQLRNQTLELEGELSKLRQKVSSSAGHDSTFLM